ncbi:MAG: hypothetical protein RBU45_26000 [Myxococcota bacterium]|nr:hypothetical protein [Myxococcota bacterium]
MQGALAAWTALVLSSFPTPVGAERATGAVCVATEDEAAGLDAETLRAALLIEQRKRAGGMRVVVAGKAAGCREQEQGAPTVQLLVGPGLRAVLSDGTHQAQQLDLTGVEPLARAAELARATVDALRATESTEALGPLVDVSVQVPLGQLPRRPLEERLAGLLALSGSYTVEGPADRGRGRLSGEGALLLFAGALGVGVVGTWSPERELTGARAEAWLARRELLGVVRVALPAGPLRLRLGAGAGHEWRRFVVRSPWRFHEAEARSGATVLLLEPEALVPLGTHLLAGVSFPLRRYLGVEQYEWQGEALWRASRTVAGATLRAGIVF